jgi:hypothetical protein
MTPHRHDLVKVTDDLIRALAEDSKNHPGEETRVSVFSFSSPHSTRFECLLYDMDVLHVPTIEGMYLIDGGTALCDAVVQVLEDLALIPEKYGEHFHLVYLVSDGEELHSTAQGRAKLPVMISRLPVNVTLGAFTPSITGKHFLMRYGFAQGNISVWDPTQAGAALEAGLAMASATTSYMATTRSGSAKSVSNLFTASAPSASALIKGLTPLTPGSYYFVNVVAEDLARIERGRIDQFMELKEKQEHPRVPYHYTPGRSYYEFSKRERIQHYKQFAIAMVDKDTNEEVVYTGPGIRAKLGLPDDGKTEVRVSPGEWNRKGYKVYVLTTSPNRKLIPGTRVLVMR